MANKAIWHNKGKLKSYGDLFHTGDTVTIVLDMDRGVLQYWLNGVAQGVAVEGLCGLTLFPAFSLYNEDDQLTLVSPKTTCFFSNSSGAMQGLGNYGDYALLADSNTFTAGADLTQIEETLKSSSNKVVMKSSAADRVFDRLLSLQTTAEFLFNSSSDCRKSGVEFGCAAAASHEGENSFRLVPNDLKPELYRRYKLWEHGLLIRSILDPSTGDYLSIIVSDELTEYFLDGWYVYILNSIEILSHFLNYCSYNCFFV